jgi:hypothetical protein
MNTVDAAVNALQDRFEPARPCRFLGAKLTWRLRARTSEFGTFETCRDGLTMSVDRGGSEVAFWDREDRCWPDADVDPRPAHPVYSIE